MRLAPRRDDRVDLDRLWRLVHDTEAVAFRIGEDDEVGRWWAFAPVDLGRAQGEQPLDLTCLIVGVQIQMNARWQRCRRRMLVEREVGSTAVAWTQHDGVDIGILAGHVVQCRHPKTPSVVADRPLAARSSPHEPSPSPGSSLAHDRCDAKKRRTSTPYHTDAVQGIVEWRYAKTCHPPTPSVH